MKKIYWKKGEIHKLKDKAVRVIKAFVHYKTLKRGFRNTMSPRILSKADPSYECVRELNFALKNRDCCNVALTGIYGSGKSSVIKTVLRKHPFKKVLKLSLSRYISKEGNKNFDEKEVERTIFQHVLYKSNPNKTPLSKYRRIIHRNYLKAICYAVCTLVIVLCGIVLWKSEWIEGLGLLNSFNGTFLREKLNKLVEWKTIIAAGVLFIASIYVLTHIIRRAAKFGIQSIKIKDVEFNVKDEKADFNTLIDELLYFFKAGNYDYVIFEDLDRIDNPKELFLKFREINLLLNESEYYRSHHKRIVFVYAIRDDVFQEEERTKFFDYIVPVIPVIDHFNASDYLLKNYKAELNEVEDKDIMALGLYIGGIRQLLNIMNEYGVYKRILLRKPLSQKKLLAMTIYKNLYPQDYSLAHSKEGCLFGIFDNKKDFSHILTEFDEKVLEDANNQIEETKESVFKHRKILTEWAQKKGNIVALIIDDERHDLDEVIKRDDLYHQVEKNTVEGYIEEEDGMEYRRPWSFSFNDIINEMGVDDTYGETMYELDNKLYNLVAIKNKAQKSIQTISNYALQKIIQTVNNSEKTLEVTTSICGNDKDKAKVLHSLIRNGYIDDDYKAYFSYTYPGAMTDVDFEFVHSVLQGVEPNYYAELHSFDQILKSIHTNNFSHESILNYSLLTYLLAKKDEVRLDLFVQTARENPYFIVSALLNEEINEEFYKRVFRGWNHCIRKTLKISLESDQKTMLVLFWRVAPKDLSLDDTEKAYLNGMYSAVSENLSTIEQKAAIEVVEEYDLKFERIRKPDENSKELYEYVLTHSNYVINADNLSVIYGEGFKTSSYTLVMKGNKSAYKYINSNLAEFMRLVPETDTKESVEAIVEILNSKDLDEEVVKQFLGRQEAIFDSLNNVNVDAYCLLFGLDKIVPAWDTIETYLSTCPNELETLVDYIKRHVEELEESKVTDEGKNLQTILLADNETLTIEQYGKLAKCFDKCFEVGELSNLEDDRLKVIVDNNLVEYSNESIDFFKERSEDLQAFFIIHFFDEVESDVELDFEFSNSLSLKLLNSGLTIEQKKWLLDTLIVINDGEGKEELARQICHYYHISSVDENTDVEFVVEAMEAIPDGQEWKTKIDLINTINTKRPYNASIEKRMIDALGGGYLPLNSLGGSPITFDKKEENETLMNYLKEMGHNVSKVIPEDDRIKVTFRKKVIDERK